MAERQEAQRAVVIVEYQAADSRFHIAHHVLVREHYALGLACGAGGIDDGKKVFGLNFFLYFEELRHRGF